MTLWVFVALAIGGILLFGVRIHGIPLTGPMYKKGMPLVDWRHSKRDIFKIIYERPVWSHLNGLPLSQVEGIKKK